MLIIDVFVLSFLVWYVSSYTTSYYNSLSVFVEYVQCGECYRQSDLWYAGATSDYFKVYNQHDNVMILEGMSPLCS